jgi:hypothetical protein
MSSAQHKAARTKSLASVFAKHEKYVMGEKQKVKR